MHVLGGTMDPEAFDRVLAAAHELDPDAPWPTVSSSVLPVLRRVHQPSPPEAEPLQVFVPPGIHTGFGIDFGPAFAHVTPGQVERWGIDHATLLATALANLRRLSVSEPPRIERIRAHGVDTVAIQGQGWGSALVLTPEVLRPIVGDRPALLLAPVRNAILALPEEVDDEFVAWIWAAVAAGCRDELDVAPLRWTGSTVVATNDQTLGLQN